MFGGAFSAVNGCVVGVQGATFSLPRRIMIMMSVMTMTRTRAAVHRKYIVTYEWSQIALASHYLSDISPSPHAADIPTYMNISDSLDMPPPLDDGGAVGGEKGGGGTPPTID